MDLVEDHERRPSEVVGEQVGRRSDLLIRDDDAVDVRPPGAVGVAPARVEVEADAVCSVRPLGTQGRGRTDDDGLSEAGGAQRLAGGESLAGARGRDEEVVRPRMRGVMSEELGLPGARRDGHADRTPFSRLQRGQSAWPLAGTVGPPALNGVTWSPCQPGCKGGAAGHAAALSRKEERDAGSRPETTGGHRPGSVAAPRDDCVRKLVQFRHEYVLFRRSRRTDAAGHAHGTDHEEHAARLGAADGARRPRGRRLLRVEVRGRARRRSRAPRVPEHRHHRFLLLATDGRAFVYREDDRYEELATPAALEAAFAGWEDARPRPRDPDAVRALLERHRSPAPESSA